MNGTTRANHAGGGDRLYLPACPICYAERTLSRHQASMRGTCHVWYECEACAAALLSLGDGRWAYQKIPRSPGSPLIGRAMTVGDLHGLLPEAGAAVEAPALPEPWQARAGVAPPIPEPDPSTAVERSPIELDALRASLQIESQDAMPGLEAFGEEGDGAPLPFAFVVAAAALIVTLLAGLGLTLLMMFWPT